MPPLDRLKKLFEASTSAKRKDMQSLHDTATKYGAKCGDMSEAAGFSQNDLMTILRNELREDVDPNAYILDVFDATLVYATGYEWSSGGSESYQISYNVADNGDVTFGAPIEVVRKVTYVVTVSEDESAKEIELTGDSIELVERAVDKDGNVMLKLISPGLGSSGYYSEAVLKRDGPKVFTKGLHNLIDHPTAQEEAARPEGSIDRLGSTLIEDARWLDDYKGYGSGLYAAAKVVPDFREKLDTVAKDIGTSIRASGKAKMGEIDGKHVPIIESIDKAKSVDYVTLPGRGGAVISLMESARPIVEKDKPMPIDEAEFTKLQESNRTLVDQVSVLRETIERGNANTVIAATLNEYRTLAKTVKDRIATKLALSTLPMTEQGTLDRAKLIEATKNEVATETAYLATLGIGGVKGLGASASTAESDAAEYTYEKFKESLKALDSV